MTPVNEQKGYLRIIYKEKNYSGLYWSSKDYLDA